MLRRELIFFILALVFIFVSICPVFAEEIWIKAKYQERTKNRVLLSGNVMIHYKNIKLFADRVELDTETKDAFAEGNVVLQLPEETVSVQSIFINLESGTGTFQNGFGLVQPSVRWEAEAIERKENSVYELRKANVTSCTQAIPRWQFTCYKADFKKDDYIEMWHSVFRIKKIPILYFPYMRYPLDREKSTGFLMPQWGFSGRKGMFVAESFYWDIKRNMDATLNFDLYSAKGLGGGLEYRYLFSEGTGGHLNLYYFTFKTDKEGFKPPAAYLLRFNHNQPLPYNFSLIASVDYQSSFEFLREFDNDFKRAIVTNRSSQVYLQRSWNSYSFTMRMGRFETYFPQSNFSIIRRSKPEISFRTPWIRILPFMFFYLGTSYLSWDVGSAAAYSLGTQRGSEELFINPVISLPINVIPWLSVNMDFATDFNYYFKSRNPITRRPSDIPLFSRSITFTLSAWGPVFYKVYYDKEGAPKVKHIIEPRFSYRYQSPFEFGDRIITPYPRLFGAHEISYELTNRVLAKRGESAVEIFNLGLSQFYYIDERFNPLSIWAGEEEELQKFSEISGFLRFYPGSRYSIDASVAFNPYFKMFTGLRIGASLESPSDILVLRLNWFKGWNPYLEDDLFNRHQIGGVAVLRIPGLPLTAYAEMDLNIQEKQMLYSAFSVTYNYQCLDFSADLRIFYFREKPETQFRITFGLGNIGKTTDFLGGMQR